MPPAPSVAVGLEALKRIAFSSALCVFEISGKKVSLEVRLLSAAEAAGVAVILHGAYPKVISKAGAEDVLENLNSPEYTHRKQWAERQARAQAIVLACPSFQEALVAKEGKAEVSLEVLTSFVEAQAPENVLNVLYSQAMSGATKVEVVLPFTSPGSRTG